MDHGKDWALHWKGRHYGKGLGQANTMHFLIDISVDSIFVHKNFQYSKQKAQTTQ